jgi:hypothetical protein
VAVEVDRTAIAVVDIELVEFGPLVAAFQLGADQAEIVTEDEVAIDAHLVVDVGDVDAVDLQVDFLQPHRAGFDSEISGIVTRRGWRRGQRSGGCRSKQIGLHRNCPCSSPQAADALY